MVMEYKLTNEEFDGIYLGIIFKKMRWILIGTIIMFLIGIAILIVSLTVFDMLAASIVFLAGSLFIAGYIIFIYLSTRRKLNRTFVDLSNDSDELEYSFTLEGNKIVIVNKSQQKNVSSSIDKVGQILEYKNYYLIMFTDNTNMMLPKAPESDNYVAIFNSYLNKEDVKDKQDK